MSEKTELPTPQKLRSQLHVVVSPFVGMAVERIRLHSLAPWLASTAVRP